MASGVGFRAGLIDQGNYHLGDKVKWEGNPCRPKVRPPGGSLKTIGYFNCDNLKCSSWQDCYPDVQLALVTVKDDVIVDVSIYNGEVGEERFAILEPKT